MMLHFIQKKNTLRLVKTAHLFQKLREIFLTGFSTFGYNSFFQYSLDSAQLDGS